MLLGRMHSTNQDISYFVKKYMSNKRNSKLVRNCCDLFVVFTRVVGVSANPVSVANLYPLFIAGGQILYAESNQKYHFLITWREMNFKEEGMIW